MTLLEFCQRITMDYQMNLTLSELIRYIVQSLNMALYIGNETSYANSFDVEVTENGFLFIPRLPASYPIDDDLYFWIFKIVNAALFPDYTLLKQNAFYFVPINNADIHAMRYSYITHCAELDLRETEIMARVGHRNPNLIHTLYTHTRTMMKFHELGETDNKKLRLIKNSKEKTAQKITKK